MASIKKEAANNRSVEGRTQKAGASTTPVALTGFMFSALVGIVSGAFALFVLSAVLSELQDPAGLFSVAAMLVAVVAGFAAGKTASFRLPEATRLVRALGVWLILGVITVIISLIIPGEDAALRTDVSGTAYTATLAVASMLAAAIVGSGSRKRKTNLKKRR